MSNPTTEIVFQNSKDKDFKDLSDREKYYRTQHHIDQKRKEMAAEPDAAKKEELRKKVDNLEHTRDQWSDAA